MVTDTYPRGHIIVCNILIYSRVLDILALHLYTYIYFRIYSSSLEFVVNILIHNDTYAARKHTIEPKNRDHTS